MQKPLYREVFWRVIDFIFPPRCISCNAINEYFCLKCQKEIKWLDIPTQQNYDSSSFSGHNKIIIGQKTAEVKINSAAVFDGPIRKCLHLVKYQNNRSITDLMVSLCISHWNIAIPEWDEIIAVPMQKTRELYRGYNQALLIARSLSEQIGIPISEGKLIRIKKTKSQVGLTKSERVKNMEDAFTAKTVAGKRILLVDDVCTTGSTLIACAMTLQKSGAKAVEAITVARAELRYDGKKKSRI